MGLATTNRPSPFSDLDLRVSLRNLTFKSGDTTATRVANPHVIFPGQIVRVYAVQNRRNIKVEGVRAAAAQGSTAGTDGVNTKGDWFSDLALPVHYRNGEVATGVLTAASAAELDDFARETSGGPQNYSKGIQDLLHILPTFAVCSEVGLNRNASTGVIANSIQPGGDGVFTVRGVCNLTFNVGSAATTTIGVVANTNYAAETLIFLDASDNYFPKLAPYAEAGGSAISSQATIASNDIVIGRLARRIDASETNGLTATFDCPVFFCGLPNVSYERR